MVSDSEGNEAEVSADDESLASRSVAGFKIKSGQSRVSSRERGQPRRRRKRRADREQYAKHKDQRRVNAQRIT